MTHQEIINRLDRLAQGLLADANHYSAQAAKAATQRSTEVLNAKATCNTLLAKDVLKLTTKIKEASHATGRN